MKVNKINTQIGYFVFDKIMEDNHKKYYLKMSAIYKDLKILKDAHPMIEINKNMYETIKKNIQYKYLKLNLL